MLRAILILCTAFSKNKSDYLIIIHHFYVKPLFHNEIEKIHEYVEKFHYQPENTVNLPQFGLKSHLQENLKSKKIPVLRKSGFFLLTSLK